jgi:hypothetical protein
MLAHTRSQKLSYAAAGILFLFLGTYATVVLAQEATTTTGVASTTPPIVAPVTDDPDISARKEIRRVEFRNQVAPQVKNRTKNLLENITNRQNATLLRMERISLRIRSRIEKEEQTGVDGALSREALAQAAESIETARRALLRITDLRMDRIVDGNTPRKDFAVLSAEIQNIARELGTARNNLGIALMRLSVPDARTATTTSAYMP